jgi:hypothetical protein
VNDLLDNSSKKRINTDFFKAFPNTFTPPHPLSYNGSVSKVVVLDRIMILDVSSANAEQSEEKWGSAVETAINLPRSWASLYAVRRL